MFESKELLRKVDYLESERGKLWDRLTKLEKEVAANSSTYEKDAKQSSKKAAEFKNRAEERKESIEGFYNQSQLLLDNFNQLLSDVTAIKESIVAKQIVVEQTVEALNENSTNLESKLEKIEEILEEYPNLDENIDALNSQLETSQESSSKISTLLKGITEKKNEIDEMYFEIAGYDEKNEDSGELEHVDGLKDKLEEQYSGLEQKLKDLKSSFDKLLLEKTNETKKVILEWTEKYNALNRKIESLLPNALTAGLSSAYSDKKENEIKIYNNLKIQFNWGIGGLIIISLVSVFISIYFIKTGTSFREVITILPNIAAAVIPLYIPMLWFTFAANKKLNLSKRLIEEYTHKEVISKTFEGLSAQIENLEDSDISRDLRLKLLFNLLEISTENPGKLISDYKSSDHPLLEVLKHQAKFEQALAKAKDYPGINQLNELVVNGKHKVLKRKKEQMEQIVDDVKGIIEE